MKHHYSSLYSIAALSAAAWTANPHWGAIAFAPLVVDTVALLHKQSRKRTESTGLYSATADIDTINDEPPTHSFVPEGEDLPPLHESEYTQVLSTMSLSPIATSLRDAYDDHFEDPRQPNGDRFAWDPWFVAAGDGKRTENSDNNEVEEIDNSANVIEGEDEAASKQIQYSLKRIQTSLFFSEDQYNTLVDDLVSLANSIGLTAITPPWTSMYTNGDTQNFHTDSTHGPMAFVLSLSKEGDFEGGETMMVRPQILDFWRNFEGGNALECGGILRYVLWVRVLYIQSFVVRSRTPTFML